MPLTIDILTIFPEFFSGPLHTSILGKAVEQDKVQVNLHNLRDFGVGKHSLTDDRPYGGGPGMVMLVEPIHQALQSLRYQKGTPNECIALTSAKGQMFTQPLAREWAGLERLCLICGHYEGVDERVAQHLIDLEVRIGDYVLTGGEPAAGVIIDAVTRLQPDVLGNEDSLKGESHDEPGVLGHPQYSRPAVYNDWSVPEVLQQGDHAAIAAWRAHQKLRDGD